MSAAEIIRLFRMPPEIFEKIAREAARFDRATARAMLQTHRVFGHYSREKLWRSLTLSSGRKASDFLSLFSLPGSADLPSYVRDLRVKTTLSFGNDPDLFKHLILLFHRVEDLRLEYIPIAYLADTIGVVSQLFTIDLVGCPFRCHSLHTILAAASSLKRLYVEDCRFDQNGVWEPIRRVSQPLSFRSPAREIYLSFGDSEWPNCLKLNGEWLGARIAAGCFKFMTRLSVNLNGIPARDVNNVLKIAGKQLSRLTCTKHEGGSPSILDLSTLVNVKEVMFKVAYKYIPWLCLSTFTLPRTAPLRAIHVPIQFDRQLHVPMAWRDMLYCLDQFPSVPTLHISFEDIENGDIFSLGIVLYMTMVVCAPLFPSRVKITPLPRSSSLTRCIDMQLYLVQFGVVANILKFRECFLNDGTSTILVGRLSLGDWSTILED